MQIQKAISLISLILLIQTIIWIICTGLSLSQVGTNWTIAEYVKWVSKPDIFFTLNYLNAVLLTMVAVVQFSMLYKYIKKESEFIALAGLSFVPIYGVMNIVCYSLQISVVPMLASTSLNGGGLEVGIIGQLIQAKSGTIIGFINGMAYAVLGIPSVLFGISLVNDNKKLSGIFLGLSGLFGFIGIAGYVTGTLLSTGTILGGVFYLISTLFMVIQFRKHTINPAGNRQAEDLTVRPQ